MTRRPIVAPIAGTANDGTLVVPLSLTPTSTPLRLLKDDNELSRSSTNAAGADEALLGNSKFDPEDEALLDFDATDEWANLVPMPSTIAGGLRQELTEVFTRRFEFYEDLDAWLHRPHDALDNATPFECLVRGDGTGVMRAVLVGRRVAATDAIPRRAEARRRVLRMRAKAVAAMDAERRR